MLDLLFPDPRGETHIIVVIVVVVPLNKRAKSRPNFLGPETATEVHNDIFSLVTLNKKARSGPIFSAPKPPQRYTTIFFRLSH